MLLLISSLVLTGTLFAQKDTINQKDEKFRKQGHWIYYGKDRPMSDYPSDGKVEEGYYKDDRKVGEWIKYHPDGKTPWKIGVYASKLPFSSLIEYDSTGKFLSKTLRYKDTLLEPKQAMYGKVYYSRNTYPKLTVDSLVYFNSPTIYDSLKIIYPELGLVKTQFKGEIGKNYKGEIKQEIVKVRMGAQNTFHTSRELNPHIPFKSGVINQFDEAGNLEGHWIYLGKDRPEKGYPNHGILEEGKYVNNRKEGIWIKYHNDGKTPKLIGAYKNNRPNGPYLKVNFQGIVIEKGNFSRGRYVDTLYRYNDNGRLKTWSVHDDKGYSLRDSNFYYLTSGCLDSIEVFHWPDKKKDVFKYSKTNCGLLVSAKSGINLSQATKCNRGQEDLEAITYKGGPLNNRKNEPINPIVRDTNGNHPTYILDSTVKNQPTTLREVRSGGNENKEVIHKIRILHQPLQANGRNLVMNIKDEVFIDGEFNNYQLWHGKVYLYDEDGILLKVKIYKDGKYHSDGML